MSPRTLGLAEICFCTQLTVRSVKHRDSTAQHVFWCIIFLNVLIIGSMESVGSRHLIN